MNRGDFIAAIISFAAWLALFFGWIHVLVLFYEAARTMTEPGMASGAMLFGVIWAFICRFLYVRVVDMGDWVLEVWNQR